MIAVNYQLQDFLKLTRYAHIYNEKSHYPPAVISAPTLTSVILTVQLSAKRLC